MAEIGLLSKEIINIGWTANGKLNNSSCLETQHLSQGASFRNEMRTEKPGTNLYML